MALKGPLVRFSARLGVDLIPVSIPKPKCCSEACEIVSTLVMQGGSELKLIRTQLTGRLTARKISQKISY